ncbi:hypothetical protein, partial [Neisseria sicca]|uniref:hypothetical protein n=1 Tax=Neisseria sicca TaxID=490 RepID=UPI00164A01E7
DDVWVDELMGEGWKGEKGMGEIGVKDLGKVMRGVDFGVLVMEEFDVVGEVLVEVLKDVLDDGVRDGDELEGGGDEDVLEGGETGG